ncbi:MAG: tetratricopeptide repeat protein [Terriglobales bacterium]
MIRPTFLAFALLLVGICCLAQQQAPSDPNPSSQSSSGQGSTSQNSKSRSTPAKSSTNPGSAAQDSSGQAGVGEPEAEESSSRDTRTDITPPPDDAKNHPFSKSAAADLEPAPPSDTTGIQEFHPWNPMKSAKDVEVGDYYFRRKNYKAALERYKEALYYKDNDAIATYRLAVCQEKIGNRDEARKNFEQYLKILPEGPLAKDARASLDKLADKGKP